MIMTRLAYYALSRTKIKLSLFLFLELFIIFAMSEYLQGFSVCKENLDLVKKVFASGAKR